ncbi:MAG: sigma-54-dependent Fis family transcriptional regulator [Acidobacteria bacterium]|nr:sigma-54-dependent Fis family transcriptional regulator [Acidobacteriota bacterium]
MKATQEPAALTLLVIDGDDQHLRFIRSVAESEGVQVYCARTGEGGWGLFRQNRPHAVLLDLALPDMDGMELLQRMVEADPGADVAMMSGQYSTRSAVEAIQKGAADYLKKPIDVRQLQDRMARLLQERRRRRHADWLEQGVVETFRFEGIIGRSAPMLQIFDRIRRIGPRFQTVLVTGATGTGKELAARALHGAGASSAKPLLTCNCSAITETLVETELFGHVRGAFTGATADRLGLFEHADGGTLFLDEIGELSLSAQAKLLRVLQHKEVQRVGSPVVRKVDVRIIAATNRELRSLVAEKLFREDLFYRLSMFEINLPRLADRREDLPLLHRHFLGKFNREMGLEIHGLTLRAQQLLGRHNWPGNIRELENVIGHACLMATSDVIDVQHLPEYLRREKAPQEDEALMSLAALQRRHARRVLQRVGGNKVKAAEILGISRTTLYGLLDDRRAGSGAGPQPLTDAGD